MNIVRNFRALPVALMGLFFVFLAVPVFSLFAMESPWAALGPGALTRTVIIGLAYWVLPLLICFSLLYKHHWFFTLYLVQCLLLTVHTIVSAKTQPLDMQVARFLLIGLMIYVGFLFGNKNFLYPLITKRVRFWRKATRYEIGRNVYIATSDAKNQVPGRLLDCSVTGVRVAVHGEDLTAFLRNSAGHARFTIVVPAEERRKQQYVIPVETRWSSNDENGCKQFGCLVLDKKTMKDYMLTENLNVVVPLKYPTHGGLKLEQDIQETALILWLVCIALSFAVPALS